MHKFLYPGGDGELVPPSQSTQEPVATLQAVPGDLGEGADRADLPPEDARWADDTRSPRGTQEARENWRPQEARAMFGPLGGGVRGPQSRRASGASHDLRYDEWAPAKRARTYVLPKPPPPVRGAGAPMGGCVVHFPDGLKPHVPQKITMSKILASLTKRQNALIESPTGTGKSLALLCSALAWHESRKVEVEAENVKIRAQNLEEHTRWLARVAARRGARAAAQAGPSAERPVPPRAAPSDPVAVAAAAALERELDAAMATTSPRGRGKQKNERFEAALSTALGDTHEALADGVFVPKSEPAAESDAKPAAIAPNVSVHVLRNEDENDANLHAAVAAKKEGEALNPGPNVDGNALYGDAAIGSAKVEGDASSALEVEGPVPAPRSIPELKPPRVYLCSRTHSQLHQLVRELKRTPYRPRYAILGSRRQYCPIKKSDEECQELTKDKFRKPTETQCGWFNKQGSLLAELDHAGIWDMEDLAEAASATQGCQFFAMKELHKTAELVLCPYNYIFDANIRGALEIDLSNAAVVIDEGHNVEDVCRDGASVEVTLEALEAAANELADVAKYYPDDAPKALRVVRPLASWLKRTLDDAAAEWRGGNRRRNFTNGPVVAGPGDVMWKGEECVRPVLAALGPKTTSVNEAASRAHAVRTVADGAAASAFDGALVRSITATGSKFGLSALATCHTVCEGVLLMLENAGEYAACACADIERPGEGSAGVGGGGARRRDAKPGLALWCLRPAVAFRPVAKQALCVIVTSGTLSPTDSLEGELGVPFPVKVEAPHIVPRRQILVEATDALGDFTAKTQESDGVARNLGNVLLRYVPIVPGGVLVFLPKYSLVERVMGKWAADGTLERLEAHKRVVAEERGADTLAPTLETFRDAVASGAGALFLAVYRGKVSEGLDFKDENARAVFCVGIPFPSLGDVKVRLKREFNSTARARSSGMLPGGDWYQHQAFRAYNQALGRCVRHQHDYAAIFMVDARFCRSEEAARNRGMVSKWMRNLVQHFHSARESAGTTAEFFEALGANPPGKTAEQGEKKETDEKRGVKVEA